jgi:DNA (cytosine-5)-methyltransferase 1
VNITVNSYFSGGGGADEGLRQAGLTVVQSVEIEPIRAATLRANFGHDIVSSDIGELTVKSQPRSDVIFGTWPCKKYSTIADIHGTRVGDSLYLHFLRHVVIGQPEAFVAENVPGMRKFAVVMEALTQLPDYYVRVECPVDTRNWLPQKRDRLILFGTRRPMDPRAPELPSQTMRLADILESDPDIDIPGYVYKRLRGGYRDRPIVCERDGIAPTCVAHYGRDRSTRLVRDDRFKHGVRPFTVREYARLQGFPDSHVFCGSEREQYEQIGDAVPVPMARWAGMELIRYFAKLRCAA